MLWHTSALIHFTFRQSHTMNRVALHRHSNNPLIASTGGDAWHHDILAYLGNINLGFAALAALRLYSLYKSKNASSVLLDSKATGADSIVDDLDVLALAVLGIANASQAYGNLVVLRYTDRWILGKGFDRITVLDTLFAVLDFLVLGLKTLVQGG